jgi:ATP-dependent exoDNAse (exonuclease V) alpha subunit
MDGGSSPSGAARRRLPALSPPQQDARAAILRWLRCSDRQVFHLAGFAGTGKTELVTRLGREKLPGVQFCAFTGKASSVLRRRGAENAVTLHSLLYGAPIVKDSELIWRRRDDRPSASLIIADECSTIDDKLGRDLLKTGIKVLVTGDALQLPPVSGTAFFGGLPDFTLTEIHRQAAGSPPLQLATAIRQGERTKAVPFDIDAAAEADVVICALNRTRRQSNRSIRRARGIADNHPIVGDRVVCLRNNYRTGVCNGTLWAIEAIERGLANDMLLQMALVDDLGDSATVLTHDDGFFCTKLRLQDPEYEGLDLFDWGYCLTAHKAQGAEWERVVVIDETATPGFRFIADSTPLPLPEFKRRWLYTAVTRAREQVLVMRAP